MFGTVRRAISMNIWEREIAWEDPVTKVLYVLSAQKSSNFKIVYEKAPEWGKTMLSILIRNRGR